MSPIFHEVAETAMGCDWRLLEYEPCDPWWNMAVDEALFQSFRPGIAPPTLRFYGWIAPAISLGRLQNLEGSVRLDVCRERGIALVRRPTGGRAVLHGTDLAFCIVKGNNGQSVEASYVDISRAVVEALRRVGAPVELASAPTDNGRLRRVPNCFDVAASFEVTLEGKKILGSAQARGNDRSLQQNSLMLQAPTSDNLNAFVGESLKCGRNAAWRLDHNEVARALCDAVSNRFRANLWPGQLTTEERRLAEDLLSAKYSREEWTLHARPAIR